MEHLGGFNPVDAIRSRIQKAVAESPMPTEGFISTMVIYGGRLMTDSEGKMVLDRRGKMTRLNIFGDSILRTYDEHEVRNPFRRFAHPRWFVSFIMPGPKRYRGSQQEIEQNIKRLGLEDYYGPHPWGIEIKKPNLFRKGIPFQDVLKADLIKSERLNGIDRFQAITEVARYMRSIHDNYGGIGEGVPYRFIFQHQDGNRVLDPVLFIPDIVFSQSKYNPERFYPNKNAAETDQKATDYIEFLLTLGFEELRRTRNLAQVGNVLDLANKTYVDSNVIKVVESFARRGRVDLEHWLFSQHNRSHLGHNPKHAKEIRQAVIEACERYRISQTTNI